MDAPVKIGNGRQFHIFLGLCKVDNLRLCVEFKANKLAAEGAGEDQKQPIQKDDSLGEEEEDMDEEGPDTYCESTKGSSNRHAPVTSY
ncbi:unnamed protein product [Eruca vesicaria subsp. sativa]|uniref:Uncharacterized protein n=1 Tax=Eruca vesicaria subsp. sativa TaxID=29727 RepID=A0ABC8JUJ9_ERUVS|nr:unnamed protein product [Eruca vesicaria subsp. sativa]